MSTRRRTWGTRALCFWRWTPFTRRSQFSSTMANQYVSLWSSFSTLTRCGRTRIHFCPLILTTKLVPDSGLILLSRRSVYLTYSVGYMQFLSFFCSVLCSFLFFFTEKKFPTNVILYIYICVCIYIFFVWWNCYYIYIYMYVCMYKITITYYYLKYSC